MLSLSQILCLNRRYSHAFILQIGVACTLLVAVLPVCLFLESKFSLLSDYLHCFYCMTLTNKF